MASKRGVRGGLGRGLDALFGGEKKFSNVPADSTDIVREIPVAQIHPNPYQPRQRFDEQAMKELADSIKTYGVLQPIIVRQIDDANFELIAGERRLRAAKLVQLKKIPAIIRNYTDQQTSEIAIIENVQRQNLNPIEEARAYQRLIEEFGYTQEKIAKKIGFSRSQIANTIRLLKLSPLVRELVSAGKLSTAQVRPLLTLENEELQKQAADMIIAENLTSKTVEAFMREFKRTMTMSEDEVKKILTDTPEVQEEKISAPEKVPEVQTPAENIPNTSDNGEEKISRQATSIDLDIPRENYVKLAENKLTELLDTPVKIVSDAQTNQIQISFSDDTQLLRIIRNIDRHITAEIPAELPNTKEEKIAALRKFSVEGTL